MSERPAPDPRTSYRHFREITTRWADNDLYGHVNNAVYYQYFDTAVNRYLLDSGAIELEGGPVIGVVVETHCNFFASAAYPDTIHVGLRVTKMGSSSVRYEIGIFRNDEPRAAAQGHFIHVYVDRGSRRPVAMPDALRAALGALQVTA